MQNTFREEFYIPKLEKMTIKLYFIVVWITVLINLFIVQGTMQAVFADDAFLGTTLDSCIQTLSDENQWDLTTKKIRGIITADDDLYLCTELVGALRDDRIPSVLALVGKISYLTRNFSLNRQRDFSDNFVAITLVRIGESAIYPLLEVRSKGRGSIFFQGSELYFRYALPKESAYAIIDDYIEDNKEVFKAEQVENLNDLKTRLANKYKIENDQLTPLSQKTRNHPLYLERRLLISENLSVLGEDEKVFHATKKLGVLRAVEAVRPLVPLLLLKPETVVNNEINERFDTIKDYPAAIALAQIGIPSIWGLLEEIAANDHDDTYLEVAYKTMTVILPGVAIPGFVNETIKKQKDKVAQLRLYKLYPLMGLPIPE